MADGQHVGGVIGFLKSLSLLLQAHSPKECIVVWEGGGSLRRRDIYPDYKAKRRPAKLNRFYEGDIPDTLENTNWQIKLLVNLLTNLPIRQIYISDCEADDVIGYIANYSRASDNVLIVSSDHDYLQLVSDRVNIWSPTLKSIVSIETVKEKTGILPCNFVVTRCFCGDRSDSIQGIKGLGIKTMVKRFPRLAGNEAVEFEDIIAEATLKEKESKVYSQVKNNADLARMNWKLMKLDVSNLSWNQISRLNSVIESELNDYNKFSMIRSLIKYGIKTFDVDRLYLNAVTLMREHNV
jgi:DNA polymerase-1